MDEITLIVTYRCKDGKRGSFVRDVAAQGILDKILQEEGCTVDRAKDGVECVDMLEKAANGMYQIILMDVQMPVMNGYDAAKKIRRMDDPQKANIPIVAMTANAFSEDKQVALDAGMNDHIAKPIDMSVLVPTLRKYL